MVLALIARAAAVRGEGRVGGRWARLIALSRSRSLSLPVHWGGSCGGFALLAGLEDELAVPQVHSCGGDNGHTVDGQENGEGNRDALLSGAERINDGGSCGGCGVALVLGLAIVGDAGV